MFLKYLYQKNLGCRGIIPYKSYFCFTFSYYKLELYTFTNIEVLFAFLGDHFDTGSQREFLNSNREKNTLAASHRMMPSTTRHYQLAIIE